MPIIDEFLESLDTVAAKYQLIRDTHKQARDERVSRHSTEFAESQGQLAAAAEALTIAQTKHNETLARHAEEVRVEAEAIATADARFRGFQERVAALPAISSES